IMKNAILYSLGGALLLAQACLAAPFQFTVTGSLATGRKGHTATLLNNGKLLVTGGYNQTAGPYLPTSEIYDPVAGTWAATGSLSTARAGQTATLLAGGKVLVVGGVGSGGDLASAELYDPTKGTWTSTGNMASARSAHTATLLDNGRVVVAGGHNSSGS